MQSYEKGQTVGWKLAAIETNVFEILNLLQFLARYNYTLIILHNAFFALFGDMDGQ